MKLRSLIILFIFIISSNSAIALNGQSLSKTNDNKLEGNTQTQPTISFSTGTQTTNTLSNMIADFNANYSASYGFRVKLVSNAFETTSQHDTYVADFQAQSTALDVISMDVIWPAEFASSGYILPLDNVFNTSYQSQFLQAQIQAGTLNGHIYSVPWFHDSAMLYYRTDILTAANNVGIINDPNGAAPTTWDQLQTWSSDIMNDTSFVQQYNLTAGFVWQGKAYEGLMCDFMEYIGATGTYSFLNPGQTQPIFNTSDGISTALIYMRSLITSRASPSAVLVYDEEGSRAVWNAGNAIFMRNWPYAYALSLNSAALNGTDAHTGILAFNVTAMPAENTTVATNGLARTSCLGGWQLGVSAYSKYPDQSKQFIMWLTAAKQQTTYFLGGGETPTLKALYNTPAILNSPQGYVHNFLPIFESALPRPVDPSYPQMSAKITPIINKYLGGATSLSNALNLMQNAVQGVIDNNPVITSSFTSSTSSTSTSTISLAPGFEIFSVIGLVIVSSIIIKKRTLKKK